MHDRQNARSALNVSIKLSSGTRAKLVQVQSSQKSFLNLNVYFSCHPEFNLSHDQAVICQ